MMSTHEVPTQAANACHESCVGFHPEDNRIDIGKIGDHRENHNYLIELHGIAGDFV
jgi:hypothetical protein